MDSAARFFCLQEAVPDQLISRMVGLVERSEELPPALMDPQIELSPLEEGGIETSDPTTSLVSGMFGNMLPRLYQPIDHPPLLVAGFIRDTLISDVDELRGSERWRLVGAAPTELLRTIEDMFWDIHDVAVERHLGGSHGSAALLKLARMRRSATVRECGHLARARIQGRLDRECKRLEKQLARRGRRFAIVRRDPKKKHFLWPPDEIGVFVELDSLLKWSEVALEANQFCLDAFGDARTVSLIPQRNGQIIQWLSVRVRRTSPVAIPLDLSEWEGRLPSPVFTGQVSTMVEDLINSLEQLSSLASGVVNGELPDLEEQLLKEAAAAWNAPYSELLRIAEDDLSGVTKQLIVEIEGIASLVNEELLKLDYSEIPQPVLAIAVRNNLEGRPDELLDTLVGIRLMASEFDLDPGHAQALLSSFEGSP